MTETVGRTIPSRGADPVTSHRSTRDIEVRANSQRHQLLNAYLFGDWTDEEAMEVSGVSERSCWWKRCSELRDAGLIMATGETRISSLGSARMICQITDKGRLILRKLLADG